MPAIKFEQFRQEVLAFQRLRRNRKTWAKYKQVLKEVAALPGVKSSRDLNVELIGRWLDSMPKDRGDVTRLKLLTCLGAICRKAKRSGRIAADPFEIVPVRDWGLDSTPCSRPRFLPIDRISKLLRHLNGDRSWEGRRLHALVALVAFTGLRRSEALNLRREDVHLSKGLIAVRKTQAFRPKTKASAANVPIPPALGRILKDWFKLDPRSEWAFKNKTRDTPWLGGTPGRRPLDRLKAEAKVCGIETIGFQLLRVSFASLAPRWGLDRADVKQILRHTNLRTTETWYVQPDDERIVLKAKAIRFPRSA